MFQKNWRKGKLTTYKMIATCNSEIDEVYTKISSQVYKSQDWGGKEVIVGCINYFTKFRQKSNPSQILLLSLNGLKFVIFIVLCPSIVW